MSDDAVYNTIQMTVRSYLPGCRVILFGSRPRGDHDRHSDYDLMVITREKLTDKEKISCMTTLDHAIVHAIHAPIDILVYTERKRWKNSTYRGILYAPR